MAGFKGAIFDMDGTLVESMIEWRKQNIAFAKRYNVEIPEEFRGKELDTSSHKACKIYAEKYPPPCVASGAYFILNLSGTRTNNKEVPRAAKKVDVHCGRHAVCPAFVRLHVSTGCQQKPAGRYWYLLLH